ncbi:hypothetical protein ACLBKU_12075 [Erythrobacter sp. NE805]|uniref:hypothetical protein n=1 Tax=Erythrobacter sp. NE805 TaxID=3389875 RepID=UPI00396AFE63
MQTRYIEWLAAERAAGRGGMILVEPSIVRGQPFELAFSFPGDLTGTTFSATLSQAPGSVPFATFEASLGAYDPATDKTLLTLGLPATALDGELPADSDHNGVGEVIFELDAAAAGEASPGRLIGLVIQFTE